jgi:hypothetical protein
MYVINLHHQRVMQFRQEAAPISEGVKKSALAGRR